jgi:hypothetical protein
MTKASEKIVFLGPNGSMLAIGKIEELPFVTESMNDYTASDLGSARQERLLAKIDRTKNQ